MFCENCGNQISDKDMYCACCGAKINKRYAGPSQDQNYVTPEWEQIPQMINGHRIRLIQLE